MSLPPQDPVTRAVLDLVEERYVDPQRIRPEALVAGALRAARLGRPALSAATDEQGTVLREGERITLVPPPGSWASGRARALAAAVAPPLEAMLVALAPGDGGADPADAGPRNRARAALLDGALRTLDRYCTASTGRRRRALVERFRGEASGPRCARAGPTVTARVLERGIVVLEVARLAKTSAAEAVAALRRAQADARPAAIVVDLRGNTGGSMLAAAAIADLFVGEGVLLEALDRHDRPVPGLQARVEAGPAADVLTPVAVLVDARTGSSAELLAAALAWNGRAVTSGGRTFGKAIVGKLHDFPDADLTVKLTSATMRAAGRHLPEGGLVPDVAVAADPPPGVPAVRVALASPEAPLAVGRMLLACGAPTRAGTLERLAAQPE